MVVLERVVTGRGRHFAVWKPPQTHLRQGLQLLLSQNVHSAGMKSFLKPNLLKKDIKYSPGLLCGVTFHLFSLLAAFAGRAEAVS